MKLRLFACYTFLLPDVSAYRVTAFSSMDNLCAAPTVSRKMRKEKNAKIAEKTGEMLCSFAALREINMFAWQFEMRPPEVYALIVKINFYKFVNCCLA